MVLSNRLTFALHNPIFGIRQRLVVSIKEFDVMKIEAIPYYNQQYSH